MHLTKLVLIDNKNPQENRTREELPPLDFKKASTKSLQLTLYLIVKH